MKMVPLSCVLARNSFRVALLTALGGLAIAPALAAAQSTQVATKVFDIPAQPLSIALQRFVGLHVANQQAIVSGLAPAERETLSNLLAKLLATQ